jgi:DNA gyrase subunit A
MADGGTIIPINIEDEMRGAYIDYSMSVIISRALPDARDGLKPVHRRVLFGMAELGVNYNKPYKKCARIVGDVLGKYHPHGDSSVYDTMVRMAQDWSLRYPLVDGQGNFGSIDGDSPAAMRYTEARLKRIAEEMLLDIYKETVDFQPNYDDSTQEPSVLPSKIPNLLLNGSSGIAVGMATNMPPHNLGEVVDGIIAYIKDPEITIAGLMEYIKAPDFPTGGIIYGYQGVRSSFETGRGRIIMRGSATFETSKTGRDQIIVTSIPYMVNKASMIERTAQLIGEKKIEGISDIRDESDRDGLRVVYDLRKDAVPSVVLNNLYRYTQLQSSFGVNNVALVKGRPVTMNLKDQIKVYVEHRHEVVVRRTRYELREARKRAHILQGLLIALDNLDAVINLIRASRDPDEAKLNLMKGVGFNNVRNSWNAPCRTPRPLTPKATAPTSCSPKCRPRPFLNSASSASPAWNARRSRRNTKSARTHPLPQPHPGRRGDAHADHPGRVARNEGTLRRRPPHGNRVLRRRLHRRGHDRRRRDGHYHYARRLHQAHPAGRIPYAGQGRGRLPRRFGPRGRFYRTPLRGDQPQLPAHLHRER